MANIGFISLGCAKNQVDCERMMYRVQEAGHTVKGDIVGSDVVVINMGCNDGAKGAAIAPFKTRVEELIRNVREKYGDDIKIVWIYGYRRDAKEYWDYIKQVMEDMGGEYGNLYACQVSVCYIPKSEGGDGYHPDVKNSAIMAEEVTAFLKNLLKES